MSTLRRARHVPPALLRPVTPVGLLRDARVEWLLIGLCWTAMALTPAAWWPIQGLWMVLVAGRLHALGVILHDACHQRDLHSMRAARWLEWMAGYPITTSLAAMRYHHLRHHRDSCMARDPYFKPGASDRWAPAVVGRMRGLLLPPAWIARSYLGCVALRWRAARNLYGRVFLGDRSGRDLRDDPEIMQCLRAEPVQALFFLAVAAAAILYPVAVSVVYLLPLILAGLLNAHRVIAEHRHVEVHDRLPETVVATTRDHPRSWLNRCLLFPRNIGYHTVHHLHPTAAAQCLPALHAWYVERVPGFSKRAVGDQARTLHSPRRYERDQAIGPREP